LSSFKSGIMENGRLLLDLDSLLAAAAETVDEEASCNNFLQDPTRFRSQLRQCYYLFIFIVSALATGVTYVMRGTVSHNIAGATV
jgi:hypothetical protein